MRSTFRVAPWSSASVILAVAVMGGCRATTENAPETRPQEVVHEPLPSLRDDPTPAREDAPETEERAPSAASAPPSLGDRLADLGLVRKGELSCSDAGQCTSDAAWTRCDTDRKHPVCIGDRVSVLHAEGVTRTTIESTRRGASVGLSDPDALMLVAHDHVPPADARLRPIDLDPPAKDAEKIARRSKALVHGPVRPVGEIRGSFGNGIDRVIVYEPRRWPDYDPEEGVVFASEYALLVEGSRGRAILPFVRTVDGELPETGVRHLDVAALVDLDADGIDEILWLSQPQLAMPASTSISISYISDGEFRLASLGGCSYNGCEAFKPEARCRAGSFLVHPH